MTSITAESPYALLNIYTYMHFYLMPRDPNDRGRHYCCCCWKKGLQLHHVPRSLARVAGTPAPVAAAPAAGTFTANAAVVSGWHTILHFSR